MGIVDEKNAFTGIYEKLNIEPSKTLTTVECVETKSISDFSSVTEDSFSIVDAEYIANELKDLITKSKQVAATLQKEIKIGAEARMYEVYSDIANSISSTLDKLVGLNKEVVSAKSLKLKKKLIDVVGDKQSQGIVITPQQLMEMVDMAKNSSQIKEIDAKFIID